VEESPKKRVALFFSIEGECLAQGVERVVEDCLFSFQDYLRCAQRTEVVKPRAPRHDLRHQQEGGVTLPEFMELALSFNSSEVGS
jgi:hypothetical protein